MTPLVAVQVVLPDSNPWLPRSWADVDAGEGVADSGVLGGAGAVQRGCGIEGGGAGSGVVGAGRHVRRQRLVPDLQGRGPADAGDSDAVGGRAVVGDAVDGLRAAA